MPFKSKKQRKWMHANKPKMAKRWEKESGVKIQKRSKAKSKKK
tara:strand:+ start:234 stop:362 length:129 start_codon:yes stop_codon:yes gene_type:complete